jgi:acetyl-CoA carboxylase biotin carboxyl carrier protein
MSLTHAQVRRILELVDSMSSPDAAARPRDEEGRTEPPEGEPVPLTSDDLEDVLALIEASGFSMVELETEGFKASVRREAAAPAERDAPPAAPAEQSAPQAAPEEEPAPSAPASGNGATPEGMVDIVAPLVGTFYRSRSPGAPPFVDVGSAVGEETEVCIIEAMKLMNYIPAGVRGTVTEVLAENEQAVEAGTPLFRVDPDGA